MKPTRDALFRPAARRARPAVLLAIAVLLAAGCSSAGQGTAGASSAPSGGSTAPAATSVPATTAPPPATVAPASTTAVPTTVPSASASVAPVASASVPPPSPAVLVSPFYAFSLGLPVGWRPQGAIQAWDGTSRVNSDGPYVDRALGPGSKLFFVYGAPTDLDLAAWSAQGQKDVNAWHGCPATAESETDVTIGGLPGRLHAFHCQGLYVMKAFAVKDGFGWAFNQIGPPTQEAADTGAFEAMLADVVFER